MQQACGRGGLLWRLQPRWEGRTAAQPQVPLLRLRRRHVAHNLPRGCAARAGHEGRRHARDGARGGRPGASGGGHPQAVLQPAAPGLRARQAGQLPGRASDQCHLHRCPARAAWGARTGDAQGDLWAAGTDPCVGVVGWRLGGSNTCDAGNQRKHFLHARREAVGSAASSTGAKRSRADLLGSSRGEAARILAKCPRLALTIPHLATTPATSAEG
mmetsp:Transcript_99325/g.256757  ORF Transcript_99325/g.256757 Transcript_99325/m.256757 type:complete len:215 (+) Transcript_99325:549-1193(+)